MKTNRRCNFALDADDELGPVIRAPAPLSAAAAYFFFVKPRARMNYQCPTCQRELYNRRLKNCGFCGASIPESLRFTADEIAAMDKEMADLEKERVRRETVAAEEEEERRKQAEDTGRYLSGIM